MPSNHYTIFFIRTAASRVRKRGNSTAASRERVCSTRRAELISLFPANKRRGGRSSRTIFGMIAARSGERGVFSSTAMLSEKRGRYLVRRLERGEDERKGEGGGEDVSVRAEDPLRQIFFSPGVGRAVMH